MNPITRVIFMLGVLPGFLSQTIHVQQIPVIWAVEGSSVTLLCDYHITGENASMGSYKWYRHIISSSTEVSDFSGRLSRVNIDRFIKERSAAITIHNVEKSDSGMYYCEVTFQIGREVSGHENGTFLNVTVAAEAAAPRSFSNCNLNIIRIILGILVVVVAALSVCCSCRGKRDGSHDLESQQNYLKPNMASPYPTIPPSEENVSISTGNVPSIEL